MKFFYFLLLLLVVVASVFSSSKTCGKNEVYKSCGPACHPTCANPGVSTVSCPKPCIAGCFCADGYLHNSKGECVKKANC
ncbi:Trypsin Inhibitor like cysteine rich domain [Popillia japonica]|uniref:Trypsin Inhibitor like cysteine rich domain n=1 Tax=Popillia japonica TaxID=7064 RepID=A0AAW1HUH5_POPJA